MIIFAHSKCKRYENRKIQGVALPEKERNRQEWKSSHHGTHHGEQDYGAVLLQVVLHSIALESPRASRLEGKSKEAVETNKDIEQLLLSIQKAFDVLVENLISATL